jgi:hypothetical protein
MEQWVQETQVSQGRMQWKHPPQTALSVPNLQKPLVLWNLEEEQWIGQVYIAIETWGFPLVSGRPSLDSQDLEPAIIHHTEFVKTCNGHTELKKYLCSEDVGLSVMQFRQSGLVLNPI